VAHRGYPTRFAENSLAGLRAALAAGARWLEIDVQLTADDVPVVLHDRYLRRLAGVEAQVSELPLSALAPMRLNPPALSRAVAGAEAIPTLAEALALVRGLPEVCLFVEIKRPSVHFRDARSVAGAVAPYLHATSNAIPIGFDLRLLEHLRHLRPGPIGWVVRRADDAVRKRAKQAKVDWVFCRHDRLPKKLWPGHRWATYTVNDLAHARLLRYRGVDLVETDAIGDMLAQCQHSAVVDAKGSTD
jgi:glycerophosphoryl diester phosphodiesterase